MCGGEVIYILDIFLINPQIISFAWKITWVVNCSPQPKVKESSIQVQALENLSEHYTILGSCNIWKTKSNTVVTRKGSWHISALNSKQNSSPLISNESSVSQLQYWPTASIPRLCPGIIKSSNQGRVDPTRPPPEKKLIILKDQLQQQAAKGNQALWAPQELHQEF